MRPQVCPSAVGGSGWVGEGAYGVWVWVQQFVEQVSSGGGEPGRAPELRPMDLRTIRDAFMRGLRLP